MDERLMKPIATGITIATMAGLGVTPALADNTTTTPDKNTSQQGSTEETPTPEYSRDDLTNVHIIAHNTEDPTDEGTVLDLDLTKDDEGETPNDTVTFSIPDLPKNWSASFGDPVNGVWEITISTPSDATVPQTWTYTITRAVDQTVVDKFTSVLQDTKDYLDHGTGAYEQTGLDALQTQYDQASQLDPNTERADVLTTMTEALQRIIDNLTVINWTFQGKPFNENGTWSDNTWKTDNKPDEKTMTITGGIQGHERSLTLTAGKDESSMTTLGITDHHVTYTVETPDKQTLTVPVAYSTGKEITIPVEGKEPIHFTLKNNTFTATLPQGALNKDNTIPDSLKTVTLSNGKKLNLGWSTPHIVKADKDARIWVSEATSRYDTVDDHPISVSMTASRSYDPSLTLTLERRDSKGTTTPITLNNGEYSDATTIKDNTTLTATQLPYDAIGDQYTVKATTGTDVTTNITSGLGDNGERVWSVKITTVDENGKNVNRTITIRQPFGTAKKQTANPNAALKNLTVNGDTIQGWDPNVLEYTIRAGEHEKITVIPVTNDGQTVKASDATQTAYTTVQHWTVTAADGSTRVYTVTLVRDHAQPTADEAFTPADPKDQGGTVDAPTENTTGLKSVGYLIDGQYQSMDKDSFTIPERGVFAYETFKGQTVRIQSGRSKGMTWTYTLGVLAPDQHSYASHSYTVTYVTAVTSKAELTGITVDGKPVDGFKPETVEYTVKVDDPNRYVASAQWDKQSGMSVTKHVNGDTTLLTATSADGLHSRTYTIHAVKKSSMDQTVESLAETGATVGLAAVIMVVLTVVGAGIAVFTHHERRKKTGNVSVSDDPTLNA